MAFLGPETELARERLAGLRQGLESKGGRIPTKLARLQVWGGGRASVGQMMEQLLGPDPIARDYVRARFTAIAAYNDYMACEAIRLLRARGLRVPEDISVTGFDGSPTVEFNEFMPTTVVLPMEELGAESVRMLYGRIQHARAPRRRLVLDVEFQAGNTTGRA